MLDLRTDEVQTIHLQFDAGRTLEQPLVDLPYASGELRQDTRVIRRGHGMCLRKDRPGRALHATIHLDNHASATRNSTLRGVASGALLFDPSVEHADFISRAAGMARLAGLRRWSCRYQLEHGLLTKESLW